MRAASPLRSRRLPLAALAPAVLVAAVGLPAVAGASPAAAADPIPITYAMPAGGDGDFYPVVEIELGDPAQTFTVLLDTGSASLVMYDQVTGADDTGAEGQMDYAAGSVHGDLMSTQFAIGDQEVDDLVFLQADCTAGCPSEADFDGVLGIAQDLNTSPTDGTPVTMVDWYSPLQQLADADAREGHTIVLGLDAGTLTLGRPTLGADALLTLQADAAGGSYPVSGFSVYEPYVPLCWTVDRFAPVCDDTTFDTGSPTGRVHGSELVPVIVPTGPAEGGGDEGILQAGSLVGYSASGAASPLLAADTSRHEFTYPGPHSTERMNTGVGVYLYRTVAFDNTNGQTLVSAARDQPSAPARVTARPGDGEAAVSWPAPESPSPLTVMIVRVLDAAGTPVKQMPVEPTRRDAVVTGLTNGRSYTIQVATGSEAGVSGFTSADAVVPAAAVAPSREPLRVLPATGAEDVTAPLVSSVVALLAGGVLLVVRRRLGAR